MRTPLSRHPIWQIFGLTRNNIIGDMAHLCDGGVLLNLEGSCLDELVDPSEIGYGTLEENFARTRDAISNAYDMAGTPASHRICRLRLAHFHKPGDWACLTAKFSHARALLPILLNVLASIAKTCERDHHRHHAFHHLNRCYQIIYEAGYFIDAAACEELAGAMDKFMVHYNWLSKHSLASARMRYAVTVKAHFLLHLIQFSKYINPRVVWAYAFESMMGLLARSAAGCTRSSPLCTVGKKVTMNYLYLLSIKLSKADRRCT